MIIQGSFKDGTHIFPGIKLNKQQKIYMVIMGNILPFKAFFKYASLFGWVMQLNCPSEFQVHGRIRMKSRWQQKSHNHLDGCHESTRCAPWALLDIKGVGTLINGLVVCIMTRCFSFSVWWYLQVPAVSFQGVYEDISFFPEASPWLPGQCRKDGQIDAMPRGGAWDDDQIYTDHLYVNTKVQ